MRAYIEATLLSKGIPYEALEQASEDRVIRWFAMLDEAGEMKGEAFDRMMAAYG